MATTLHEPARTGPLFVLAAAVLWGTTGTAQAFAPDGAQPMVVGTLRQVVGGMTLLAIAAGQGHLDRHMLKGWPFRDTLLAALSVAAYQVFFFAGVARTGVAVGTIVDIGSAPIAGGIIGYLVRGERPGKRWLAATFLAIIGCGLLAGGNGRLQVNLAGLLMALAAGAAYASYTTFSKGILEERPPEAAMAVVFTLGAFILLPVLLLYDLAWVGRPAGIAVVLHLGLVTMAAAYALFARGLMRVPVATAVTLTLAEPLTASILGIAVLGEHLNPVAFTGIALLFTGLIILTRRRSHPPLTH